MLEQSDQEFINAYNAFPDKVMYNSTYREVLQYMGTAIYDSGIIKHEFRHRAMPVTNKRQYFQIEPTQEFKNKVYRGEYKEKTF